MGLLRSSALMWALALCPWVARAQSNVYLDAVGAGWDNWSWSATLDFANASPVQSGTRSVAVALDAWGGLSLHHAGVNASAYGALEFWIHGGSSGGQVLTLYLQDDGSGQSFTQVPLNNPAYLAGGTVSAGQWKKASLPLSALGISTPAFTRITWWNGGPGAVATFYLDEVRLVPAGAVPPTLRGGWPAGPRTVTAFFDQPIEAASITSAVYQVQNAADPNYAAPVAGTAGAYDAARRGVSASFPHAFGTSGVYTLTLNGLRGTNGLSTATNTTLAFTLRSAAVTVQAGQPTHAISPFIYGVALAPDAEYLRRAGLTANRWGGNHSSRYNWQTGTANRDFDWYFENFDWDGAGDEGSAVAFARQNLSAGAAGVITVPALPWVAKDATGYSFSVAKYGPQQSVNPYAPDRGNGRTPSGQAVTNDPADASVPARPFPRAGDPVGTVYQDAWLRSWRDPFRELAPTFFPFVAIDNEPELWGETHRDVHPQQATYQELLTNFIVYAGMVRSNLPGARILGPVSSGWWFFWNTQAGFADKAAHGDQDFLPWFLDQVRSHDLGAGTKSLDLLDIHFYPTDVFNEDVDEATRAKRLRSTRAFWDATYQDEGWIGVDHWATYSQPNSNCVMLLPRFHGVISNHYPGLQLALTEWNMGAESDPSAGLAVADALGIFGRERLDLANYWANPATSTPVYAAFQLYGNPDGAGGRFETLSLPVTGGPGPNLFGAYAARSPAGDRLTLVLVNKDPSNAVTVSLALNGFTPAGSGVVYRLSRLFGASLTVEPPLTNSATVVLPPYSATHVAWRATPADGDGDGLSDAWESLYPAAGDPAADADGDGAPNRQEYAAGTHPLQTGEVFALRQALQDTNLLLAAGSARGRGLVLEAAPQPAGPWTVLAGNASAGGACAAWQLPATSAVRHFRARLQ